MIGLTQYKESSAGRGVKPDTLNVKVKLPLDKQPTNERYPDIYYDCLKDFKRLEVDPSEWHEHRAASIAMQHKLGELEAKEREEEEHRQRLAELQALQEQLDEDGAFEINEDDPEDVVRIKLAAQQADAERWEPKPESRHD